MRFSERTNWKLLENTITKVSRDLKQAGKRLLDLTESNPTRCGFSLPEKQILHALLQTENLQYEPSAQGLLTAREEVCRYYAQKGFSVNPEDVFLTASTSEAYSFLFRLLADVKDAVLFPVPSYPLFEYLCNLNDLTLKTYSLTYDHSWRPNLEKFRDAVEQGVRAVVLVNPNNPTGSFIQEGDFVMMNALCLERQIPIISDEVFFDYGYETEGSYFSALRHKENLTFTLGGISKSLGLPQMKLSWIVVHGPEALVQASRERLEIIADTYLSAAIPIQNALADWFKLQPLIQKKIKERISANRRWLMDNAGQNGLCEYFKAEGGWYAVLKLPAFIQEEDFIIALLQQEQVLVYPGYFFDFADGPFMVVSLLPENSVFEEAMTKVFSLLSQPLSIKDQNF